MGLVRLGRHLSYKDAARIIGHHFPDIDDKIVNTLELGEMSDRQNTLIQASLDQRITELNPFAFNKAIDFKENLKYWPILVVPVLVFLFIALSGNWSVVAEGGKRIVEYNMEFVPEAPFTFIILNEKLEAEEGDDFTIRVGFKGESIPESAEFVSEGRKGRFTGKSTESLEYTVSNVSEELEFRIYANGFYSETYRIPVIPVPRVRSYILEVVPPAYTGRKSFITQAKTFVDVAEGSKVSWELKTTSASSAQLITNDSSYVFAMQKEGVFRRELKVVRSLKYSLLTQNSLTKRKSSSENEITVIKDVFPDIEMTIEQDSINENYLFFRGRVSDDYGFTRLELRIESGGKLVEKRSLKINGNNSSDVFSGLLNLDSIGKIEGGISVYSQVWDNDGVNGAKSSSSERFEFKLLSKKEKEERVAKEYGSYASGKQEIKKDNETLKEELERLMSKLRNQKKSEWKDKESVREMVKRRKELLKKQQDLEKKREDLENKTEQPKDKENLLKEEERKIEELKDDPKQEELNKLLDEIGKLMEKMNLEQLTEKLEQMNQLSEQEQRRQERLDKLLEELKFQKDVLKQAEKLEEMAERQKELAEDENSDGMEENKQKELQKEFENLKEKLKELENKKKEFKKKNVEKGLEDAAEEIERNMDDAQEEMEMNDQKGANDKQQESSENMQKMSQKMMQSLMQMKGSKHQEDMETLRQILENLETLSFSIEDLSELSKASGKSDPLYRKLLVDQKVLMDGALVIEDSLVALGERVPQIKEVVYDELEGIKNNLDKSVEALQEQNGGKSASHQQFVMTAANNLALLLDEALRSMQQQMANQKQGNQNCQKPGSGKPSPANMRKLQNELGKKMGQMKSGKKQGQGEKGKGEQRSGKELVEMLSRQEQLRKQLEEYMENEGSNGSKGNMQKAIEEMKEIEKDLLNGDITLESLERIREIETRLLESEKAELEQKQDQKRESETARDQNQMYKEELEKYLKGKESQNEEIYFVPLNMNIYYRNQSNQYIKRF